MLCRVVGASVSGFYAWLRAIPSRHNRAEAEAELRGHIGRIFAAKRRVYGAPRIHAELRREGHRHARRRIERLMRDMGLQASRGRRRKPETTDSRHDLPVAPNLLGRSFVAERPDTVWLADISHIPTDEGFLYLAAISTTAGLCGLSFLQRRCEAMSSRSEAKDWAEELEAVAGRIAPRVRAGGAAPTRPGLSSGPAGPLGAEERLAPPRGGRGPTPQPPAGV